MPRLRSAFFAGCLSASLALSLAADPLPAPDVVVAADGTGNFRTIQEAIASIPRDNRERTIVFVKEGVYREKVRIDPAFVTLRGESRTGTRIEFSQGATEFRAAPDPLGQAVVNLNGDDCVLENLTVQNTHGVIGVHAFAIYGRADRTVIVDCDVLSQGNDTLSLWKGESGRYYHARLNVRGSVDFVCPRGWCYMTDCTIFEVNPNAEAAIWHDGSRNRDMKFVLRNCRFDGVEGWRFARHHHDAEFILIDCTFSKTMRDRQPKRVIYPLNGGTPSEEDLRKNQAADPTNLWGERFYYFNCHREGGDFAWFRDNLPLEPGAGNRVVPPEQITAKWTFAGTWDPENKNGPVVKTVARNGTRCEVTFSENITVKGKPQLVLRSGARASYASGSGSQILIFDLAAGTGVTDPIEKIDLNHGAIFATEAAATLRDAELTLPESKP
jgi:pectinesterase